MNFVKKTIYYVVGIFIAGLVFYESNTIYPKLVSVCMIIMVIYMGISRVVIPKNLENIFICKNSTKIYLSLEKEQKLIEILSKERGHINLNRDYVYDDRILVITSQQKQILLYFGVSNEGNEAIKINKGFFEVELDEADHKAYKQILEIDN